MGESYKPITSMKEVPEQLRKLRRQYLRYQQAQERFELIEAQMQSAEGVTEELKRQNPMDNVIKLRWQIKTSVLEIILGSFIL